MHKKGSVEFYGKGYHKIKTTLKGRTDASLNSKPNYTTTNDASTLQTRHDSSNIRTILHNTVKRAEGSHSTNK